MIEILQLPIIVFVNAFLTGVFTKLSDVINDDGLKVGAVTNLFFGFLWGLFGVFVVLGNVDVAAFYLGILLSWIHRFKLDNYSHGIGGSMILAAIYYVHPHSKLHFIIIVITCILFTFFGLLSRYKILSKSIFINYNIYSFIFLGVMSLLHHSVIIVFIASLANVFGYHMVKEWWRLKNKKQMDIIEV